MGISHRETARKKKKKVGCGTKPQEKHGAIKI
jgi:hypothetical protein